LADFIVDLIEEGWPELFNCPPIYIFEVFALLAVNKLLKKNGYLELGM
jgi:hypothetical protein